MPDEVWANSVIADTILAEKENANATHELVRSGVSAHRRQRRQGRRAMVLNLMPRRRPWALGKLSWGRSTASAPGDAVDLASAEQLARKGRLVVTAPDLGTTILLVWTRRGVFALENRCPHRGARLDDATVGGRTITCSMHGRRYDLRSGRCSSGATALPLRIWPARIVDGRVLVGPLSPSA
jgi:nitrite reductase/ring-hydroxylating ferredoxin subunit